MNKNSKNNIFEDDDIDLLNIVLKLWKNKKLILYTTIIFFIIGIFYSLSIKNIYKSSSTFYPHYEKIEGNSLKNLAGLAGINITNEFTSDVPTSLYPNLITSTPFKNEILSQKIKINNKLILYKDYLQNKNKSFIKRISNFIKGLSLFSKNNSSSLVKSKNENYIILTIDEYNLHKSLNEIIHLEVHKEDGYITLTVKDEIPYISAEIAKKAEEILQKSIINYKLKNIKSVYNFTIKQLESSKNVFYKLQDSLAYFKDRNRNIKTDLFKNQLNRLQSEYDIANSIYNELVLNKEKTAIEVQKNTPIFTIINPVTLPIEKSNTSRRIIVIIFSIIGFIIISLWVIIKDFVNEVYDTLKG